jgi:subtilisin family serine protease
MRITSARRSLTAAASVMLAITLAGPLPAAGSGSQAGAADLPVTATPPEDTALDGPATVTLVTGDRVTLTPTGGEPEVTFDPAPGATHSGFSVERDGTHVHVVPSSVASLVPEMLDPALFNISALIEMGYDDQHSDALALIVRGGGAASTFSNDGGPLRTVEQLESIAGAAVHLDKDDAADFGAALAEVGELRPMAAADALGGVEKIWLDSKVEAAGLDGYLDQIEGPAAWESGLDGSGVTVAVLDTGIDDEHPAPEGQVRGHANFTDAESAADEHGHGTHVASLIAGTGAGADGARHGVAPNASLLSAKVLNDDGAGQASWVIAGMEWAVDQGADVVNMSLGGPATETDDPVVESLDALAEQTGTLFVVAAGNDGGFGESYFTINTPGSAASLTVGAVTETDATWMYSSNGPTLGSYRLKPEITAPGVEIRGARAGARVDELYVPMSGTSMATPIVAGAAALLIQQRPESSGQEIKALLITTAHTYEHQTSWSHGNGRLDLNHGVHSTLRADLATLDFGYLPFGQDTPQTRTLTLTNDGAEPVVVDLVGELRTSGGVSIADGAFEVSPASLTVPAGGSATAAATLDPALLADGPWEGGMAVVSGDSALLRLPIGAVKEPERYDLEIQILDHDGAPYDPATGAGSPHGDPTIQAVNAETGLTRRLYPDENGYVSARLAPGVYSLFTRLVSPGEDGASERLTIAGTAGLEVRADTAYVLDAREAQRLEPPTLQGQPTEARDFAGILYATHSDDDRGYFEAIFVDAEMVTDGQVFITPTEPVETGRFDAVFRWRLASTGRGGSGGPDDIFELVLPSDQFSDPLSTTLTRREINDLATVEAEYHPIRDGREHILGRGFGFSGIGVSFISRTPMDVPAAARIHLTADPAVSWGHCLGVVRNSYLEMCGDDQTYDRRERDAFQIGGALRPAPLVASHGPSVLRAEIGLGSSGRGGQLDDDSVESSEFTLFMNGRLVDRQDAITGHFHVPDEAAMFRLEHDMTLRYDFPRSQQARTVWTFESEPAGDPFGGVWAIPPLLILDYDADLDEMAHAVARRPLHLDLRARHLTGAEAPERIESMRVWWSVDDGDTWREASARRTGADTFRATLLPVSSLAAGASVSLRAVATDPAGNEIDQTVLGIIPVR